MIPLQRRAATLILTSVLGLSVMTACGSSGEDPAVSTGPNHGYYLSIGDSYAAGYEPATDGRSAQNSTSGFAWKVASKSGLELVNYACSGISAQDYVTGNPCIDEARPPQAPTASSGAEAQSVVKFLDDHGSDVKLVTIILSGNDFQHCTQEKNWRACATREMAGAKQALDELLTSVREHLASDVPVIGLTYPNVLLAEDLQGPASAATVDASIELFRDVVNPVLAEVYADHQALFVDVTDAFDGYAPPTRTVDTDEYGTIPARAAAICELTYFCAVRDVHPTAAGHQKLADLVLDAQDAA